MKNVFTILLCCFASLLNAKTVDEQTALQVASYYYYSRSNSVELKLSTAHKEVYTADTVLYYIFNVENNNGWVIVSATDATFPILGFSMKSEFPTEENQAPALAYWMNKYKKQILTIIRENSNPTNVVKDQWEKLLSKAGSEEEKSIIIVNPLLTTEWDQGLYYNAWCPGGCMTGCVATAMAQIMKYWEEPINGTGDHCYWHPAYGEICGNFGITTYDWNAMPNQVTSTNTPVATLMYHCGVAVEMNYCSSGTQSGAYVLAVDAATWGAYYCAEHAYVDFFGYNANTIEGVFRGSDDNYWINNILKTELDAGRPIQYVGDDNSVPCSHTWVCDGYNSDNEFHMNWGWGGYGGNGYFNMNNLTNGTYTFDDYERALIGIQPATAQLTNDDPCDAIMLQVTENCEFTDGTNVGATNSSVSNVYCDGTSNGDVWFKCVVPSSGNLTITTDAGTISDMGMAIYSGTCNNLDYIGCYANGSSYSPYMPVATLNGMTPGEILWIRLWEFNNNSFGSFSICAFGSGTSSGSIELSDFEIDDDLDGGSDGDGDGLCEPGEVIELSIELFNSGNDPANNIEAVLSSNDPDIDITDPDVSTSLILPGEYDWISDFDFAISSSCPEKDVIFNLIISSDEGSWDETLTVHIYGSTNTPVANFVGEPVSGNLPLIVNFTDLSSNATSWSWDFGDGYTSDNQNPVHTYTSVGIYNVSLTVQNEEGSDTELKANYINVTEAGNLPVADFVASPISGNAPLYVSFTNKSLYDDTWLWDFGDGSTSHMTNPYHTYTTPGYYTVSLTVTNEFGSDTEIKQDFIHVTEQGNAPTTNFTCNTLTGQVPLSVNFTDQSVDFPTNWYWEFGDGSVSYLQNPAHVYQYQGTFTVSLTTSNDFGSDTETKANYITVYDNSPNPSMGCANSDGPCPLIVNFEDNSTNFPTSWFWNFGDGFTSALQNPQHIYTLPGIYTVIFTVSNQYGSNTLTATDFIHVYESGPMPHADFTSDKIAGPYPLTVKFTNLSDDSEEWEWQFGDGNISFSENPVYTFSNPGYYTITLIAHNQYGFDTKIKENYIHVISGELLPVADFGVNETNGSKPLTVNFYDYSQNAIAWNWQFGDGNMSSSQNPTYTYANIGDYTVTLKVNNQYGEDILTKANFIHVVAGNPNGNDESAELIKYSIIPNPSNGVFSVCNNTKEIEEATYSVYSIAGTNLVNGVLKHLDKNILDLSGLKPGLYIFIITTKDKVYNTRIIIV